MSHSRIFADFHNADAEGRLRLNCIGTIEDLTLHNVQLQDGQLLTLYSEDLEADGVVQYSEAEKVWVATIDWTRIRQIEDFAVSTASQIPFESLNSASAKNVSLKRK